MRNIKREIRDRHELKIELVNKLDIFKILTSMNGNEEEGFVEYSKIVNSLIENSGIEELEDGLDLAFDIETCLYNYYYNNHNKEEFFKYIDILIERKNDNV